MASRTEKLIEVRDLKQYFPVSAGLFRTKPLKAELLEAVKKLDKRNEEVGVRAFMWNIEATV